MRSKFTQFLTLVLAFVVQLSFAQEKTITGNVTDQSGLPLPGVNIVVKGTTHGTQTDFDGNYSINVGEGQVLQFTYIGMSAVERTVGSASTIDVQMQEDAQALEEVVVVGYGQERRMSELTGSSSVVGSDKIEKTPLTSVDQALQGNAPGVYVSASSGQPGALPDIRIRGISSINGNNSPLYIINGVPVISGDPSRNNTSANILANINSNDIESITILKDASATAVYGARAANGVVIITTKKGKGLKPVFNVSLETGFNEVAVDDRKPLTGPQWGELYVEAVANAFTNGNKQEAIDDVLGGEPYDGSVNTNWRDVVRRGAALQQNFNASLTGSTEDFNYYSSIGYFEQEGIVKNSDFQRVSGNLNVSYKVNDKLKLSTDVSASNAKIHTLANGGAFSNPILSEYFLLPTDPVRNEDGSWYIGDPDSRRMSNGLFNPGYLLENNFSDGDITRMIGNISAEYNILDNLKYTGRIGLDYANVEEGLYWNPEHGDGFNGPTSARNGYAYFTDTRLFNFVVQNILNYKADLSDEVNLGVTFIQEAQKRKDRYAQGGGEGIGASGLYNVATAVNPSDASTATQGYQNASYSLTANLGIKDKIFIDGTFRREGDSRFAANKKWGNFWSVGLGWNLAKENFLSSAEFIDLLKLRVSYGELGNTLTQIGLSRGLIGYDVSYNENAAAYPTGVDNPDLTWEVSKPFNVGVDFEFLDRKLTGSIDYFSRTTEDLLYQQRLSRTSGHSAKWTNIGEMVNKGIEFALSAQIIENDNFSWSTDFNISTVNNKVTELIKGTDGKPLESFGSLTALVEDEPVNVWYMRKWAGVDPETGAAQWYRNGKGGEVTTNYTEAQQAIQEGNALPKVMGGFTNNFSYKGFNLSFLFSYGFGHKVYEDWGRYLLSDGQYIGNYPGFAESLDRWQKPGDITNVPKLVYGQGTASNEASSRFLHDGDFIRLRDVTFGYDLPESWLQGSGLTKVNIYLRATNLYTFIFDDGLKIDPEIGIGGITNLGLPPLKTASVGVNISL
ncbi:SusC/RagA family TonB-linked outer membrane protein [Sinomicrobium sp.]